MTFARGVCVRGNLMLNGVCQAQTGACDCGDAAACEICHGNAPGKSIGRFQVYDGDVPTLTRPCEMCQACHNYAVICGMTPVRCK